MSIEVEGDRCVISKSKLMNIIEEVDKMDQPKKKDKHKDKSKPKLINRLVPPISYKEMLSIDNGFHDPMDFQSLSYMEHGHHINLKEEAYGQDLSMEAADMVTKYIWKEYPYKKSEAKIEEVMEETHLDHVMDPPTLYRKVSSEFKDENLDSFNKND